MTIRSEMIVILPQALAGERVEGSLTGDAERVKPAASFSDVACSLLNGL